MSPDRWSRHHWSFPFRFPGLRFISAWLNFRPGVVEHRYVIPTSKQKKHGWFSDSQWFYLPCNRPHIISLFLAFRPYRRTHGREDHPDA